MSASRSIATDSVEVQLRWYPQFQFAGYIAAIEKGFYAEEGLDVTLRSLPEGSHPVEEVLAGRAEYGVGDAGLIVDSINGRPVILVAQYFQHSPLVFVTREDANILEPKDLAGKRVRFTNKDSYDVSLRAMIIDALGSVDEIQALPYTFDIDELPSGQIDAISSYFTASPFLYNDLRSRVCVLNPQNYGFDFYGDNLFTTQEELERAPERIERMRRATNRGWAYALAHKEEIVDIILEKYTPQLTREQLMREAELTDAIVMPSLIEIGSFNKARFHNIARTFQSLGMTSNSNIAPGFFYPIPKLETLTPEETRWLHAHPYIEVTTPDTFAPYSFVDSMGKFQGISVEVIRHLERQLDINFIFKGHRYNEMIKMIKKDEVELGTLIDPLDVTDADNYFTTTPYSFLPYCLFVRGDNPLASVPIEQFKGKRIALVEGWNLNNPGLEPVQANEFIVRPDHLSCLNALLSGEVDAFYDVQPIVNYIINKNQIQNVQEKHIFELGFPALFHVNKDMPELYSAIEKALHSIPEYELFKIHDQWQANLERIIEEGGQLILTEEEKAWLKKHPQIRLASDKSWAPLEFVNKDNQFDGLAHDYIKLIEYKLGIEFIPSPVAEWEELIEMGKEGKVDVFSCVTPTPERQKYLTFTKPYVSFPTVIITRSEATLIHDLKALSGRDVGVVGGYAIYEFLKRDYPNLNLIAVENINEGLSKVVHGELDAFIGGILTTGYYIRENKYNNTLKIAGEAPYENTLHIGVRQDWPQLHKILQKTLDSISPEQHEQILNKWAPLKFEHQYNWQVYWKYLAGAVLLVILIIVWNRMLSIQVKRRTQALSEAVERYQSLYNAAADSVLLMDGQYFIESNPKGLETFECTEEEFIGKTPMDFSPPVQPDGTSSIMMAQAKIEAAMAGENPLFEWRHKTAHGKLFDTEVSLTKVEFNNKVNVLAIVRDISSRKAIEQEMIFLNAAVQQANEHILICNQMGIIIFVNPAFINSIGFQRDEIIGSSITLFQDPELDDLQNPSLSKIINDGKPWAGCIRNSHRSGKTIELSTSIVPIQPPPGESGVNYLVIQHDMSRENELEKQLRQAQKMEAIGTLAGGIAHDFNNILSAILGYAELARLDVTENPRIAKYLQEVMRAGQRAKELVSQILAFSRQTELKRQPIHLQPLVKEVVRLLRASIPNNISIRTNIDTECPLVMAEQTQMHQVVMNLCTNAFHAIRDEIDNPAVDQREHCLTVTLKPTRLDKDQCKAYPKLKPGSYVILDVQDTGCGMSPASILRIFEPYYTTKKQGEGTGLGLANVHGIIESHGGMITVESKIGEGSLFRVYLPQYSIDKLPEKPQEQPSAPTGNETILFIDDETALTELGQLSLEALGYRVTVFNDPAEALSAYIKEPEAFDIVITDQSMPKLTGFDVACKILAVRPQQPIILCTGYSESVTRDFALKTGISEFVYKPITGEKMAHLIRNIFDSTTASTPS